MRENSSMQGDHDGGLAVREGRANRGAVPAEIIAEPLRKFWSGQWEGFVPSPGSI